MLYIDFIGSNTIRLSNEPEGAGRAKFLKNNIRARQDSLELIWISNTDNESSVLNCYPVAGIALNGHVYGSASLFVGVFNLLTQGTVFVPPDSLDVSGRGYTSSQIDDYLIHHAFTLETENNFIKIKGNGNPTSRSNDARQWLYDHVVAIDTNDDFIELI
jgi:hypothetical protein